MPGRDGTGPTRKGPMTGKGSGSCMLKIPDNPAEPIKGFAGEAGRPFGGRPNQKEDQMPGRDGTGPKGMGKRTGRAAGFCMRLGAPGISNRSQELNPGESRYQGGREEQMETLQARAKQMEKALDGIRERIRELETGKGKA